MRRHVTLEVKVSQLVSLFQLEEGSQLLVGIDLATILLVLKVVGANILVDFTSNIGTSHLGSFGLSKKTGKLVGNQSGLHETGRCAISNLALLLHRCLLGILQLASGLALKKTKLTAQSGPGCVSGLKLIGVVGIHAQKSRSVRRR